MNSACVKTRVKLFLFFMALFLGPSLAIAKNKALSELDSDGFIVVSRTVALKRYLSPDAESAALVLSIDARLTGKTETITAELAINNGPSKKFDLDMKTFRGKRVTFISGDDEDCQAEERCLSAPKLFRKVLGDKSSARAPWRVEITLKNDDSEVIYKGTLIHLGPNSGN